MKKRLLFAIAMLAGGAACATTGKVSHGDDEILGVSTVSASEIHLEGRLQGVSGSSLTGSTEYVATRNSIFCEEWSLDSDHLFPRLAKRSLIYRAKAQVWGDRYRLVVPTTWPKKQNSFCRYQPYGDLVILLGSPEPKKGEPTPAYALIADEGKDLTGIVCSGPRTECHWQDRDGALPDQWPLIAKGFRSLNFDISIVP